jgi:hypothetical protein
LNAEKLWRTTALIYVNNGQFAITAIGTKLVSNFISPPKIPDLFSFFQSGDPMKKKMTWLIFWIFLKKK